MPVDVGAQGLRGHLLVALGDQHRGLGDRQVGVDQRGVGHHRRGGPGLLEVGSGLVGPPPVGEHRGALGGHQRGVVAEARAVDLLEQRLEGLDHLVEATQVPHGLQPGAAGQRRVQRSGERERPVGRRHRLGRVAQLQVGDGPSPAHDALPRLAHRPRRDAVELGQRLPALVGEVVDHRPAQAGERDRLLVAERLPLEDPGGHAGEALGPVVPPGQLAQLQQAGQLTGDVAQRPEGRGDVVELEPRTPEVALDRRHRGQQAPARMGAGRGRQQAEPLLEHVAGHRRVERAQRHDDRVGHVLPGLGVDQQPDRGTGPVVAQQGGAGLAAGLGHLGVGDVGRQHRAPQRVERPASLGHHVDQRQAGQQLAHLDVGTQHRPRQVLVELAQVGQQGDLATPLAGEPVQNLLADVVGGDARAGARRQLGQRRPAAGRRELHRVDLAQRGEGGELVGGEGQVALVEVLDPPLDLELRQRDRRRRAPRQHHVAVGRERRDHRRQQLARLGSRGHLVHVVDQQRHLLRRPLPQRLDDVAGDVGHARSVRPGAGADRLAQPLAHLGQGRGLRRARHPQVDADRGRGVGGHGLREQGGLAVTRGRGHDGDRHEPTLAQALQKPVAHQHGAIGGRWFKSRAKPHA
jgi:hypothetical protein